MRITIACFSESGGSVSGVSSSLILADTRSGEGAFAQCVSHYPLNLFLEVRWMNLDVICTSLPGFHCSLLQKRRKDDRCVSATEAASTVMKESEPWVSALGYPEDARVRVRSIVRAADGTIDVGARSVAPIWRGNQEKRLRILQIQHWLEQFQTMIIFTITVLFFRYIMMPLFASRTHNSN